MQAAGTEQILGRTIKVVGCSKMYVSGGGVPVVALDGIDLDFQSGSVTALCGPSGSGKSTLLHLVGGMDRPSEGQIIADGEDLGVLSSAELVLYRRSVGFVFQSFALLPALTARDNVMLPVLPYRSGASDLHHASQLLTEVGLEGREDALPSQLSGGQRQRVAIARALMGQPRLIVADEPTGNLDSETGMQILEILFSIRKRRGITILIGTHDETLATRCDHTVRLRDGRVAV